MLTFARKALQAAILFTLMSLAFTMSAKADIPFSGSGSSGTLSSAAGSEPWYFNYEASGSVPDWGIPGVGNTLTTSGLTQDVYALLVTFTSEDADVDLGSIATGNGAGCLGGTSGGSTFCTFADSSGDSAELWEAYWIGPDEVEFLAVSPSDYLAPGQYFFTNVFFGNGVTPSSFTGEWLTEYQPDPVPEPTTLLYLGTGLVALGTTLLRRRRVS